MLPGNFTTSSMAFKLTLNSKDGSELRVATGHMVEVIVYTVVGHLATAHMVEVIPGNFTDVDLLSTHGKIGDYMVK